MIVCEFQTLESNNRKSGDINFICSEGFINKFAKRGVLNEYEEVLREGHNLSGPKMFHFNNEN